MEYKPKIVLIINVMSFYSEYLTKNNVLNKLTHKGISILGFLCQTLLLANWPLISKSQSMTFNSNRHRLRACEEGLFVEAVVIWHYTIRIKASDFLERYIIDRGHQLNIK